MRKLMLRNPSNWGLNWFNSFDDFFRLGEINGVVNTDIKETKDNYILELELPGFDKENIDLSIDKGYLVVKAENVMEKESKNDDKYLLKERSYGSVSRAFYVGDMGEDEVDAVYNNGVLTLTVPKESKAKLEKVKRIKIK